MPLQPTLLGTNQHDTRLGTQDIDVIVGLAGNDNLTGLAGADTIYGDFLPENLLSSPTGATSLAQYAETGKWVVETDDAGNPTMSQEVETIAGARYEVSFEHAANYASGHSAATVTVFWNGAEIGTVDTASGVFSEAAFAFTGTGAPGTLTFEIAPTQDPNAPEINTDGPISYYTKTMTIGGAEVEVKAFAEGQAKIYQVMDGKLHVFDPETESYAPAGAPATVKVNAVGFNIEDDMIYGIAVGNGQDSLGNKVSANDLVMYDAEGHSYRMGETPYRSWTGDFDDKGNLWYFESDFDRVTMVDVDQIDADGNPLSTTFKFPTNLITQKVWDVGYDAATSSFYGLVRPKSEGGTAELFQIDISEVASGGDPVFTTTPVTETLIDGVAQQGVPYITFGAFVVDGDGNLYAGGNGGDHDMNDATGSSGGIYRVLRHDDGSVSLELVSDAPRAYSNDGAVDARAMDPFAPIDPSAVALIRGPALTAVEDPAQSYDDAIAAGAGKDAIYGGYGDDVVTGGSAGDRLEGDTGNDALYGGAGPGAGSGIYSVYDDEGLRYDLNGNLLGEEDDYLSGGAGADLLDGSAGHDTLDGGAGDDTLDGGSGHDELAGGTGEDALSGGREDDTLSGGDGEDTLDGGTGNDVLSGDAGNDTLKGGADDDALSGGAGADRLDGGKGADVLSGDDGDDYLKAGSGDDLAQGGEGRDYINAGSGNDTLDGGADKDRLYLGAGDDIATGGAGSDRFVFRSEDLDGSTDLITDFTRDGSQADRLDFRALDLLAGSDAETWLAENTALRGDGAVEISLDADTLLVCTGPESGTALLSDVHDGIMF